MMSSASPLLLVVPLLVLSISSSIAHGAGAGGDQERRQRFTVVQTSHFQPQSICSGLKGTYYNCLVIRHSEAYIHLS